MAQFTLLSTFANAYADAGLRARAATRAALDAEVSTSRLTTAELSEFAPPDIYAAGLKALQMKETR